MRAQSKSRSLLEVPQETHSRKIAIKNRRRSLIVIGKIRVLKKRKSRSKKLKAEETVLGRKLF